jgi:hypothetical protein
MKKIYYPLCHKDLSVFLALPKPKKMGVFRPKRAGLRHGIEGRVVLLEE